eukprot:gene3876-4959_t
MSRDSDLSSVYTAPSLKRRRRSRSVPRASTLSGTAATSQSSVADSEARTQSQAAEHTPQDQQLPEDLNGVSVVECSP